MLTKAKVSSENTGNVGIDDRARHSTGEHENSVGHVV